MIGPAKSVAQSMTRRPLSGPSAPICLLAVFIVGYPPDEVVVFKVVLLDEVALFPGKNVLHFPGTGWLPEPLRTPTALEPEESEADPLPAFLEDEAPMLRAAE